MKMNNKVFTMVELLVAMAIMGLLVIMAFPTIRAVQTNNTNTKYEEYGKSVISAAKLYVDSYGEDEFDPSRTNQRIILKLDKLVEKDLIKDINVSGSSCLNGESNIWIVKYDNDYAYCLHLTCKSGEETVFESKDTKGSCKGVDQKIKTVTYKYDNTKGSVKEYTDEVLLEDMDYVLLTPERAGFNVFGDHRTFHYWTESGKPNKYPNTKYPKIEGNVVLNAYTTPWKYTIKFDKGVGDSGNMGQMTCTYDLSCPLLDNKFVKKGYELDKWVLNVNGTTIKFSNKEDVWPKIKHLIVKDGLEFKLTATYKVVNYTITYHYNGGAASNPTTYNINSGPITINNPYLNYPTSYYYLFDGWTGTDIDIKTKALTIKAGSVGNRVYYANWYLICSLPIWHQTLPSDDQVRNNGSSTTGVSFVNTYKWAHNSSGDSCTGSSPKREYYFAGFMCRCSIDSQIGRFCGGVEYREITQVTHPNGKAHIYYANSDNGRSACKGDLNVNSYVARVCQSFYPDGVNAYHGYVFYPGAVGWYSNFSPSTYWTHSGGNFDDRIISGGSAYEACYKACSVNFP